MQITLDEARKTIQSVLKDAGFYHGEIDGMHGPMTEGAWDDLWLYHLDAAPPRGQSDVAATGNQVSPAVVAETPPGAAQVLASDDSPSHDARSEGNISTLHPNVRPYMRAVLRIAAEKGITAKVTSGTRSAEEQNELYEQGRSKPGKIVTNARAWQSNHNFGLAADFTVFVGANPKWEGPEYTTIGHIGESLGMTWGGRWTNDDEPHLELYPPWAKGMNETQLISSLRSRHENGKDAFA